MSPDQERQDIANYIGFGSERTNVEFKQSIPWTGNQPTFARTIMAMANQRDGGYIIVGIGDNQGTIDRAGITPECEQTFNQDAMLRWVNNHVHQWYRRPEG